MYSNEPGQQLLQSETCPLDLLAALAEHPSGSMEIALGQATYRVTVSPFEMGDLLVLRPLPQPEEKKHPFSNAVYRMRECLSNFTAVQWKMKRVLEENHLMGDFDQDLANQSRLIFQMLRLTRQAELTQELNDKAFPREEGFDLAMVCQGMADETTWLADLARRAVLLQQQCGAPSLPGQQIPADPNAAGAGVQRSSGCGQGGRGGNETPCRAWPVRDLCAGQRRGDSRRSDGDPLFWRRPRGNPAAWRGLRFGAV